MNTIMLQVYYRAEALLSTARHHFAQGLLCVQCAITFNRLPPISSYNRPLSSAVRVFTIINHTAVCQAYRLKPCKEENVGFSSNTSLSLATLIIKRLFIDIA